MLKIINNAERVALGGLLHDIGKLLNRSDIYSKKSKLGAQHPHLSSWFIDYLVDCGVIEFDEPLREIVQKHHEGMMSDEINLKTIMESENNEVRKLGLIVARADNYSSAERINEEDAFGKRHFKTTPLDSIFTRINIKTEEENKKELKDTIRYKVSKFNDKNIFPVDIKENHQGNLDEVIKEMLEEVKEIKAQDFDTLFINLLDILKKYTWALPSDTQKEICDISLYDHLKMTSAIARASYNYHNEENINFSKVTFDGVDGIIKDAVKNHFLIIGGDISGIQKYIYSLEDTKGAAKRLRGRSFFIKLLADMGAYKIIDALDLTLANIIISSGGKFYILAHNTEDVVEKLETLKKEMNDELYRDYHAELFLNLEWIEACGNDLGTKFHKKYDELNDQLDIGKNKKFTHNILNNTIIESEIYGGGKSASICKVCGKNLILENEEECNSCSKDKEIGGFLPDMKKLAIYKKHNQKENKKEKIIFGLKAEIITDELIDRLEENPWFINYYKAETKRDYPYLRDVYGGKTPKKKDKDETMSFEDIAEESKSRNLGIIKGDVDNLGLIFSVGMNKVKDDAYIYNNDTGENKGIEEQEEIISISRIATLSRMMDNFFSYWLPENLKEDKERNVDLGSSYVVYSGGDDFMIVAAWDNAVKISEYINRKFGEYTKNNDITLTIGIEITKESEPIYFSSQKATEAEEIGKSSGKNGLVLFNTYIPWDDYPEVFNQTAKFIDENMKKKDGTGIYSQGFIYRLLNYTEMAEKYIEKRDPKYLKYISDFTYDLGRNLVPALVEKYKKEYPNEENAQKIKEAVIKKREVRELTKYFGIEALSNKKNKEFLQKYMRVVLNYVVRKNRDNSKEEN